MENIDIVMANSLIRFIDNWAYNRLQKNSAFNIGTDNLFSNFQYFNDKPSWISLTTPQDFESAARHNPIVKAAINILSTASSNGKKIAIDISTGEEIPWTSRKPAIQKAYKLLMQRPNPLQSSKEFAFQGTFYLKVFGNRYVYANMPVGYDREIDIMNISTLINLPSQFMNVHVTGKLYDQTDITGIISEYSLNNFNPPKGFKPEHILHFNEVNISGEMATIMGISKLEALKYPITNIQKAFEAMNTLLTSRGMQGILSPKKTDGMGASMPLQLQEKTDIDNVFKRDYGLLNGQNPFMLTPIALDYIKTVMNSKELGIYEEFSNNAMIVSNEFGIPPELLKTYISGATYENQVQSVRRLYQDTVIPMVEDEDSYWSCRLNTYKYGFVIQTSWEHIPALAESFKEKAISINLKGRTADSAYDKNLITVNTYLEMIEEPAVSGGDVLKIEWEKDKQPIVEAPIIPDVTS